MATLAFDLDGTLSDSQGQIHSKIVERLRELSCRGWEIFFITGRGPDLAKKIVQSLPFSYYLGCINGSILYKMPEEKLVHANFLSKNTIDSLCDLLDPTQYGAIFYTDSINKCYQFGSYACAEVSCYVQSRCQRLNERLFPLKNREVEEQVFSAKFFGRLNDLLPIQIQIEKSLDLIAPIIKDPFHHTYYVMQATDVNAHKGALLEKLERENMIQRPLITGGNDLNDMSLLKVADFSFAIKGSPGPLKKVASLTVGSIDQLGALEGINKGLTFLNIEANDAN